MQFLAGWRIAGEVLAASKWGPATTFWGGAARGTTQGALADGLAFDPRNPRLSNLIDPDGKYPITNILSAKPEDSALEGRLKNSAEGVLIGNVISGLKLAKDSAASIHELISRLKSGNNTIDNAILKRIMDKYPWLDDASQDGLRKFAAKSLNLAEEKLTIKNPVEGSADAAGAKGVSGAPVFLVRDENGQISGVIKKFPEKLLPVMGAELVSMQTLKNLGLRQSHSITALEGAKLPDGGALLLSPASGSAIDDLFERAGRLPDGPERQVAINELRDAMRRIGVAGAELHTVPPGSAVRPATALQEHIGIVKEKLEKIVAALPKLKLEKGSERLSARDLQTRVDELIEGVKRNPGAASVIHGDFHPGNIFFDKEKGVTLIDLGRLHESLDVGGRPIGPPARDYAGFHQEITHFGRILKLRDSEIDELSNIFKEAYQRKGPALTDEATRFFRARTAMGEFIKVVITKNESSPAAISDEVRILKRALNIR